ncbi:Translation initiation factor eIF-2B subunit gamma, partial [Linum perenne]
ELGRFRILRKPPTSVYHSGHPRKPFYTYPFPFLHLLPPFSLTLLTNMDFQVVVLAGGTSKELVPLVSKELPKALLPVANRPLISYVLEQLELSNLKDLIVVVEGEDAALRVSGWISVAYGDRHVEVAAVPEDVGTAGALRAIAHRLTAKDILVVSGDLVSDVLPGAVAAAHRRHGAVLTTLLCSTPISGPAESGSTGAKDKIKKPKRYNIIGLDPTKQFLLYIATGVEVDKDVRISKRFLRAVGQMDIQADLMDAHMYAFKRAALQDVLERKEEFQSLRQDVLPYLVRTQLKSDILLNGSPQSEENGDEVTTSQSNQTIVSQILSNASTPGFHEVHELRHNGSTPVQKTHKCCAHIASNGKYCARLNSIQAFCDINRDVTGEANHLSGYTFSAHNNVIHPTAQLGSKTTVGPHCILGEGTQMGDKCSVKRSVIGRHCRIGSNVKIVNSIVMDHATIGDGCSIQGSVISSNIQFQERVVLKDCQVVFSTALISGTLCITSSE